MNTKVLILVFLVMFGFQNCSTEKKLPYISQTENSTFRYGEIVWYDLITPNLSNSIEFYKNTFNWDIKTHIIQGEKYAVIYQDNLPIGGMIEIKSADSSIWISARSTKDINAYTDKITENGGKIIIPKVRLPGRGYFSIIEGNLGEKIALISALKGDPKDAKVIANKSWLWTELWSDDPTKSANFYSKTFNITTNETSESNLPYWEFKYQDKVLAGMIKNPLTNYSSVWVPYIKIENVNSITENAKNQNGTILLNPNQENPEKLIAIIKDPQGAIIGIQNWKNKN